MAAENGTNRGAGPQGAAGQAAFAAGLGAAVADGAVADVPPTPGQAKPTAEGGLDRITVVGHATG